MEGKGEVPGIVNVRISGLLTAVLPVSLEDGTDDGVHYTPGTYKRIFAFCLAYIRKTENYFDIEEIHRTDFGD